MIPEDRRPAAVGIDETMFLHARRRVLVTGVVDVATGLLLDVFEGREAADLRRWMAEMPTEWLEMIQVVSVDPHEGYRSAVVGDDPTTGAPSPWRDTTIVVDPFHIVRLGNQAVTKCRQRVQQDVVGHRGRKDDPLYRIRRLLLVGSERLNERGWERLRTGLDRGDALDQVLEAWMAKEKVRSVYLTDDVTVATTELDEAIAFTGMSNVPEVKTIHKTLRRWRAEILARGCEPPAIRLTPRSLSRRCDSRAPTLPKKGAHCGRGQEEWMIAGSPA